MRRFLPDDGCSGLRAVEPAPILGSVLAILPVSCHTLVRYILVGSFLNGPRTGTAQPPAAGSAG